MPEMDGIRPLNAWSLVNPGLPIIMVTANADVDLHLAPPRAGRRRLFPKPFDLDYLGQAVSIQVSAAPPLSSPAGSGPS